MMIRCGGTKTIRSATFQNFGKDSYSFPSGIIWPDDCDSPFLSLKFYDPWSAEIQYYHSHEMIL